GTAEVAAATCSIAPGTGTGVEQPGQRTLRPAVRSGTFSLLPHDGQATAMAMIPPWGGAIISGRRPGRLGIQGPYPKGSANRNKKPIRVNLHRQGEATASEKKDTARARPDRRERTFLCRARRETGSPA